MAGHDQVVDQSQVELCDQIVYSGSGSHVLLAGTGNTGGVIVCEDHTSGAQLERSRNQATRAA